MSSKTHKLAIVGFRHGHIGMQIKAAQEFDNLELVATCEEDAEAHAALEAQNLGVPVYSSYDEMLEKADCDVVGTGDYFSIRGQRAIKALEHGKHFIGDKPLCTSLEDLNAIKVLSAEKNLQVGCLLDVRGNGNYRRLRRLIQDGNLGEIHSIAFNGQHPLNLGSRAAWYFEPGKQGGTINDIGIHAFDFVPWLTGSPYAEIVAAREWNARVTEFPEFREAGQVMLALENGCGVLGDVSYLTPESFGYTLSQYWRINVWGDGGMAETDIHNNGVHFYQKGYEMEELLFADKNDPLIPIDAFLKEIDGENKENLEITTAEVLRSNYVSLMTQKAANENSAHVSLKDS